MLKPNVRSASTLAGILTLAVLVYLPSAGANHFADAEDNDSCGQANGISTGEIHNGYIDGYPSDYKDFYAVWVDAGEEIFVLMDPTYQSNADFNLVLYYPNCVIAEFDYRPGNAVEAVNFIATEPGYWYSEVWGQVGSGLYGIVWSVSGGDPDPDPCVPTSADPATYNAIFMPDGRIFYVEERGNPFGFPVPGSGMLAEGTWIYEETNGQAGLQRGGINVLGGPDPINDENCGFGPDAIIF